jgi:thioredoxin-related protein
MLKMNRVVIFLSVFILSFPLFGLDVDFNIDKISSDANKTKKHIMLFLHKDNCGYCERMSFNLDDKNISKAIKKDFILLDINRDDDEKVSYQGFNGTNSEFMKALGIDFYPSIIFIDGSNDKIIYGISGYRDTEKLMIILDYINSKSYKKMNLEEFKDELFFN